MAASGKRRARLPSMHDVAARSLLVLLFASGSAGAALFGTPLLALVAGFVAVALAIDIVFPVTGFLRIDSQHAFQRLAWQRRREGLAKRSWGRDRRRLELLPSRLEQTARRRHLGIQPIPLDSIIGTTEPQKAVDFDHAFRPPSWSRGRWELMWMARRRGDSLPPISVYRLHGRHFVIDGHHRVSVERSLDAASVDADVIELIPLSANPGVPQHPSATSCPRPNEGNGRRLRLPAAAVNRDFAAPAQPEIASGSRKTREIPASADVAQLVEHFTRNEGVPGSSPGVGLGSFCREFALAHLSCESAETSIKRPRAWRAARIWSSAGCWTPSQFSITPA
jgi:hypothetical protein